MSGREQGRLKKPLHLRTILTKYFRDNIASNFQITIPYTKEGISLVRSPHPASFHHFRWCWMGHTQTEKSSKNLQQCRGEGVHVKSLLIFKFHPNIYESHLGRKYRMLFQRLQPLGSECKLFMLSICFVYLFNVF